MMVDDAEKMEDLPHEDVILLLSIENNIKILQKKMPYEKQNKGTTGAKMARPSAKARWQRQGKMVQERQNDKEKVAETIETKPPKIPRHLHDYVRSEVEHWADSLITAMCLTEQVHYVKQTEGESKTEESAEDQQKNPKKIRLMPVDCDHTGEIQKNTQLDHGTHQFLQIFQRIAISPLNLCSAFKDVIEYIQPYGPNLHGLSGTIGSAAEREFFQSSETYNADTMFFPPHKESKFLREPDTFCATREEWLREICSKVLCLLYNLRGLPAMPSIQLADLQLAELGQITTRRIFGEF